MNAETLPRQAAGSALHDGKKTLPARFWRRCLRMPRSVLVGMCMAPLAALLVPALADPLTGAVRLAAITITESYWASALFALVLILAYASFQDAERDRK